MGSGPEALSGVGMGGWVRVGGVGLFRLVTCKDLCVNEINAV